MTRPHIPERQISAAMARLVEEGRAEWTTTRGQPALRLTALGKALLRHPEAPQVMQ